MTLHRNFFLLAFIVLLPYFTLAQSDSSLNSHPAKQKPPFSSRLAFGGYLGLSFGDITYVEIAPLVGYRVTDNFTAGLGLRYIYYKDNFYNYESNIYGGTIFGRYNIFRGLFVEADFEANNLEALTVVDPINQVYTLDRQWIPSLLLGGGYSSAIGNSAGFYISILYDVIQDPNSPYYRQPIIRAGVGVGL